MSRLIIRLLVNVAALVAAAFVLNRLAPGSIVIADWASALLAALLLGMVNAFIRPLVSTFTCLLQLLTLGLFTLVINALMLLFTSWLAGLLHIGFQVNGFGAAFFGAILMALVSTFLTRVLP